MQWHKSVKKKENKLKLYNLLTIFIFHRQHTKKLFKISSKNSYIQYNFNKSDSVEPMNTLQNNNKSGKYKKIEMS